MEREREQAVSEPVAQPAPAAAVPPGAVARVLALQRSAGNHAVGRMLARKDKEPPPVSGVSVSPSKSTLPVEAGNTITAKVKPASLTGVTYELVDDTASAAAGTSIDATTGAMTIAADQEGGALKAKATAPDGSWGDQPFHLVEKPATLDSTTSTIAGTYEVHFTHTFSSASGSSSALEGANINEKFDSLSAKTPFGDFSLDANKKGSKGWDLDASGTMAGVDKVSIGKWVDASKFIANASNPTPAATLPQGFSMTQKLVAKGRPSGKYDDAPFTTTEHVRTLEESGDEIVMTIAAGDGSESVPYAGTPIWRNMTADSATVEASEEKPKKGKWNQNSVTVSVEGFPTSAKPTYSIAGEKLGCSVDKTSGKVLIGDKPGTIEVRGGTTKHYDAVKITITARAAPAPVGAPAGGATGSSASLDVPQDTGDA